MVALQAGCGQHRRGQHHASINGAPLGGYSAATLLDAPKHGPLVLRLRAHGSRTVLTKAPGESVQHLVLKGLLWSLLLPTCPNAACEVELGMRYKPDVVSIDEGTGQPRWWGECGSVKASKLQQLATTFPDCRFTVAKWGRSDLRGYASQLVRHARCLARTAASHARALILPLLCTTALGAAAVPAENCAVRARLLPSR